MVKGGNNMFFNASSNPKLSCDSVAFGPASTGGGFLINVGRFPCSAGMKYPVLELHLEELLLNTSSLLSRPWGRI